MLILNTQHNKDDDIALRQDNQQQQQLYTAQLNPGCVTHT
jgi:hypothetical protein